MVKVPFTVLPIAIIAGIGILFAFYIPQGSTLISKNGDFLIGIGAGILLLVCVFADNERYKINR